MTDQAAATTTEAQATLDPSAWAINAWRPSNDEKDYELTRIEGEVPRELNGTLYRNGPSQHILPEGGAEVLHLFDGDGLVHAFRFDDGRVHYRGRFVRDPSFIIEEEEGRFCMDAIGVKAKDPTDRMPIRQQHNTNIVWHGGKLMALVENAWPFEVDARSLDPVGETDFDCQRLGMSVSAHPHIDARTGQMVIHGYQPFEPYYQVYVVEPDGRASLSEPVDAPYAVMMHDMMISENHIILPLCPVTLDAAKLMGGEGFSEAIRWEPDKGLRFGIRRREAGSEVRWFDAPTPAFMFHLGNAYEEDGKILMDACSYLDGGALLGTVGALRAGGGYESSGARPFLSEFDLEAGTCRETQLSDRVAEFPRIDDRLAGYRNRWGYALVGQQGLDTAYTGTLCKYDREGGPSSYYDPGSGQFASEAVFVPRTPDAAEDDGFVLTVVYDAPNDSSYLLVLEAQDIAAGPVAKAHLEHRIPMGFHGNFVSA